MYTDDVIRSLRLPVSARGSSEVSTDFARQKDLPPQYRGGPSNLGTYVTTFFVRKQSPRMLENDVAMYRPTLMRF